MTSETLVLGTSIVLLAIGATGVLVRRNPIAMLMSVELMLNAANLLLVLAAIGAWLAIGGPLPAAAPTPVGGVVEIGRVLFGRLIVPFELTAPLLLVAIVGPVVLGLKRLQ